MRRSGRGDMYIGVVKGVGEARAENRRESGTGNAARTGRERKRETEDPPTGMQGVGTRQEYRASPCNAEETATARL